MSLYEEKLNSLQIDYKEIDVKSSFGNTRVIKTGNENGNPVVIFHGINAGAPLTLEAVKDLRKDYLLYAIDTIGQATKSDENRIDINDNSYALWATEVLNNLNIDKERANNNYYKFPSGLLRGRSIFSSRQHSRRDCKSSPEHHSDCGLRLAYHKNI